MSTKKLTIISSLIVFLLVASGLAYYFTYSNVKKNLTASTTETTDSSQVVKQAEEQTVNTLNTQDEKATAAKTETDTKAAANIAKENVNFKYIEYTVKSGDTLFSIARNNAPNLKITDVINNIVERNSLKDKDSIIVGQKISVPQSIDTSKANS